MRNLIQSTLQAIKNSKGLQPVAQFDEKVINHIKQIP